MKTKEDIKNFIEKKYSEKNIKVNFERYSPESLIENFNKFHLEPEQQLSLMVETLLTIISSEIKKITIGFQITSAEKNESSAENFSATLRVQCDENKEKEYKVVFDADIGFKQLGEVTSIKKVGEAKKNVDSDTSKPKILIGEDSELALKIQKNFVEKVFEVQAFIFEDGTSVLEETKKEKFDILLLDNKMPGANGLEIAKEIKTNNDFASHSALIFLFTADNLNEEQLKFVDGFYPKPLKKDYIVQVKVKYEQNQVEVENTSEIRSQAAM